MSDETTGPVLNITPDARAVVVQARASEPDPETLGLWIEVNGESGDTFTYDLWFQAVADATPNDSVSHHDDLALVVPASSIAKLQGATLTSLDGSLALDNPNKPAPRAASPSLGAAPADLSGDVAQRVIQVLDEQINPSIAMHGGQAELVAIEDGIAYLRLSGGCQGCGLASVTLSQGIAVAIRESVPEVVDVRDVTDHASGANPFYEPAKK